MMKYIPEHMATLTVNIHSSSASLHKKGVCLIKCVSIIWYHSLCRAYKAYCVRKSFNWL